MLEKLQNMKIPQHNFSWLYYAMLFCLFLVILLFITGFLLNVHYEANIYANSSIDIINHYLKNGFLIRNIHSWASSILVGLLIITSLALFSSKSFDGRRILSWVIWLAIVKVCIVLAYSGHILIWNELSVLSTQVSMGLLSNSTISLIEPFKNLGSEFANLLMGGSSISIKTLGNFYILHSSTLPILLGILITTFCFLIYKLKLRTEDLKIHGFISFKSFLLRNLSVIFIGSFIVLYLGLCLPFDSFISYPLKVAYDFNLPSPQGVAPEWYLLFISYNIRFFSQDLVQIAGIIFSFIILLSPILFSKRSVKFHSLVAIALGSLYLFITIYGGVLLNNHS